MLGNRTVETAGSSLLRSRWAAIGAAIAVSLGAGGVMVARAAPGPAESTIVSVTPERILDTRDPVNVGLPGPFVSPVGQKLQVTGSVLTTTGPKVVVPAGATGVLLNVTSVGANANGFVSIRPGDATGAPATSSLNVNAGVAVPNAVQVSMPTAGANAGQIDITWDAYGVAGRTTDILIDVVGYTTNTGLQQLVADVALKANSADVYTKAEVDAMTGVASATRSNVLALTASDQTVLTANITTVAGSSLLATTAIEALTDGGDNDNMNCNLNVDGTDGLRQTIDLADAGFNNKGVLTLTQVFAVGAGVHTVIVECNQGIGSNTTVESAALSILATR